MKNDFAALLAEESPDAAIITMPSGKVPYWNKGAGSVFGRMLPRSH